MQTYTSAGTSINTLTKVYTKMDFSQGNKILDYGAGKYDTNKEYMKSKGKILYTYDPYNRPEDENNKVLSYVLASGGVDYVVCANVLNVIAEDSIIEDILHNLWKLTRPGGIIYIQIYEGDKSGISGPTKRGYQRNWKASDYARYFIRLGWTYKRAEGNIFIINR